MPLPATSLAILCNADIGGASFLIYSTSIIPSPPRGTVKLFCTEALIFSSSKAHQYFSVLTQIAEFLHQPITGPVRTEEWLLRK